MKKKEATIARLLHAASHRRIRPVRKGGGRNANPRQTAGNPADKPAVLRKESKSQTQANP